MASAESEITSSLRERLPRGSRRRSRSAGRELTELRGREGSRERDLDLMRFGSPRSRKPHPRKPRRTSLESRAGTPAPCRGPAHRRRGRALAADRSGDDEAGGVRDCSRSGRILASARPPALTAELERDRRAAGGAAALELDDLSSDAAVLSRARSRPTRSGSSLVEERLAAIDRLEAKARRHVEAGPRSRRALPGSRSSDLPMPRSERSSSSEGARRRRDEACEGGCQAHDWPTGTRPRGCGRPRSRSS